MKGTVISRVLPSLHGGSLKLIIKPNKHSATTGCENIKMYFTPCNVYNNKSILK